MLRPLRGRHALGSVPDPLLLEQRELQPTVPGPLSLGTDEAVESLDAIPLQAAPSRGSDAAASAGPLTVVLDKQAGHPEQAGQPEQAPKDGSLGAAVSNGVRWTAVDQGFQQVARLLITIVLTRLTSPSAYGLIALALVVTQLASFITDLGMGPALVHRRELRPDHVRTALSITALVGVVLALITIATSGLVADFFKEPKLVPVLVVLSLSFPIRGLLSIPKDLLRRDLHFKQYTLSSIWGVAASGTAGIVLAFLGAGVWALVAYSLVESLVGLIAAVILSRPYGVFSMRPGMTREALKDLTGFGAAVSGWKLLYYIQINADNLLVGRVLGTVALGYYSVAYRLMLYPIQKVADVIANVALPAFAALQHDRKRLRDAFLRGLQYTSLVTFPLSIGILVSAPVLIPTLLGHKWIPAVACVQVLALNGPRLSVGRLNSSVFQAVGKPSQDLYLSGVNVVVYVGAFAIGVQHGIVGMAVAYTLSSYLLLPLSEHFVAKALETTLLRLLLSVWPIAVATLMLVGAAEAALWATQSYGDALRLVATALAGAAAYIGGCLLFARPVLLKARKDLLRR